MCPGVDDGGRAGVSACFTWRPRVLRSDFAEHVVGDPPPVPRRWCGTRLWRVGQPARCVSDVRTGQFRPGIGLCHLPFFCFGSTPDATVTYAMFHCRLGKFAMRWDGFMPFGASSGAAALVLLSLSLLLIKSAEAGQTWQVQKTGEFRSTFQLMMISRVTSFTSRGGSAAPACAGLNRALH